MDILVSDLLQLESLRWSHTVAGIRGLSRKMEYIDVWEVPEMEETRKENVLFLSSGYALKHNVCLQEKIIPHMVERKASGLAIQTGYFTPIPEPMLEQANRLQFPLIELPKDASFTEIIHEGMRFIFNRQGDFLRYSQEFHRRLTEVILTDGDSTEIARVLAAILKNTVIIADQDFRILGFSGHCLTQGEEVGNRTSLGINSMERLLNNLKKTGIVDGVRKNRRAKRVEFLFSKQGEQAWVVVPVIVKTEIYGFIAILENHRRLEEMEWDALQQASGLIAMAVYKQKSYALLKEQQQNDLVFDILDGNVPMDESRVRQAEEFGWIVDAGQAIMAFDIINFEEYYAAHYRKENELPFTNKKQLLAMIGRQIKKHYKYLLTARKGTRLVAICMLQPAGLKENSLRQFAEEVRKIASEGLPQAQVGIAISHVCSNRNHLQHCYQKVKDLLVISQCVEMKARIYQQTEFAVYQLLLRLRGTPELREFYLSILGPLENLDADQRDEMIKTLEGYFAANGSINRTAEILFLHRNSINYRLGRLSELLQINLDDAETRFRLQLALKARYFCRLPNENDKNSI